VVDNCGSSTLTATSYTGSLVWSNGATTSSITLTTAGNYTVTQTVNGCTSPSGSGVAAPNAMPALTSNLAASIATGTAFAYTPTSTETGTTFTWSRTAVEGISNADGSGNGDINETLNNISGAPVNVAYVYTLTANGCANSQNVVVTVNPAPPVATRGINPLATTNVVTRKKTEISKPLGEQLSDGKLNVQVFPNPSNSYFNLVIKGDPASPVTVRVLDISGRVVEKYEKIASTTALKLGYQLRSGSYFAEVMQGSERKVVKIMMMR
jgi:hypothetical protein